MLKASLSIEEKNNEEAERVYLAAFDGENLEEERIKVASRVQGNRIFFEIEAKDPVAMRAVLNTILRNYKLICTLKDV